MLSSPVRRRTWGQSWFKPFLVPVVATAAVVMMVVLSVQVLRRWQQPIAPTSSREQPRIAHQQVTPDETPVKEQPAKLDAQIVVLEAQKAEQEKVIKDVKAQLTFSGSDGETTLSADSAVREASQA